MVAETRAIAEDAVAKVDVDLRAAAGRGRHGDGARARHAASSIPSSATTSASSASTRAARSTRPSPPRTRWWKPPSTPAATPALTLEPRSILADYNRASGKLTVYHATQAPHMMQGVFAQQMRMPEGDVRVICTDIGGSYGIKVHVYPDEVATAVIAKIMAPPGEVHRRPAGELHHRHPRPRPPHQGPHGRRRRGPHHRHRHRRPHRHRPLLGLPAHQRGGGQPGGEPGRRPLRLRELPRQDHGGAAEQDADLPVPRRRPPHRHRRHRGPGRPRRRSRRPRSGRVPPPQSDGRRHLSAHLARRHEVRGALAHRLARQADRA